MQWHVWLICNLLTIFYVSGAPTLLLPNHISSHMVLQQTPVQSVLWGLTTISTKTVSLAIDGTIVTQSTPDTTGHFTLTLPAYAASLTPHTLNISDGLTVITLDDVVFGDVFLCSGQSNMEFGVRPTIGGEAAINESFKFPFLRLYAASEQIATSPAFNSTSRFADGSAWVRSAPLYVGGPSTYDMSFHYFSAACYYFGRELYKTLDRHVPIGLLATPRGGSIIESWTSVDALKRCDSTPLTKATSVDSNTPVQPVGISANDPSALFNGSVSPYLPMRFKSVIWYQGESNSNNSSNYACRFPVMIHDWRKYFNDPNLPFVFVLLAAYIDDLFPLLRLAQIQALSIPRVNVASPIDLGDCCTVPWGNVHSRLKEPLGYRIMLSVMRHVYHDEEVVADGPAMTSIMWPSSSSTKATFVLSYNISYSNNIGLYLKPTAFCADCCTINSTNSLFQIYTTGLTYNATTVNIDNKAGTVQIILDPSILPDTITAIALENTGFPQCVLANSHDLPSLPWYIERPKTKILLSES